LTTIKENEPMTAAFTASNPRAAAALKHLHQASKGDKWVFARALPGIVFARLRGVPFEKAVSPHMGQAYIGVPPEVGNLLYLTARAIDAKHVVEFGTSFGISALSLGAAMHATGGHFVGSENELGKIKASRATIKTAGLSHCAEIRAGDAMETFKDLAAPIDLVLLDGWKDLYLPMLKMLTPKLRTGSVIIADNIHTFKKGLAPYVAYVQSPANGFQSTTLPIGAGIEYSIYGR
jgi:predicted O-methyltransferase YrrM